MPIQKGKRRKRTRSRPGREPGEVMPGSEPATARPTERGRSLLRKRREPPLWANVLLGIVMVVAGTYFTIASPGGMGSTGRLVLLIGYLGIGAYYFFKAYRQYMRKRQV